MGRDQQIKFAEAIRSQRRKLMRTFGNGGQEFLYTLFSRMSSNLLLKVTNVHLRYENLFKKIPASESGFVAHSCVVGVMLSSLHWKRQGASDTRISMGGLSVY